MPVVMGHYHLAGIAGTYLLSAYNQGNIKFDTALSLQFGLQGHPLGRAFEICFTGSLAGTGKLKTAFFILI